LDLARRVLPNNSDVLIFAGLLDRRQNRWTEGLRDLQQAMDLDPRNGEIIRAVADTYLEMRQYGDMEKLLKRALVAIPEDALVFYAKLADCQLARGDPKSVVALFVQAPRTASASGFGTMYRFTAAIYLRDYESAKRSIASGPPNVPDSSKGPFCPHAWFEGIVARAQHDDEGAKAFFGAAREIAKTAWGESPEDPARLSLLARIDAALERKDDAVREGKEAIARRPVAKDALDGPMLVTSLAVVYAWTGERDLAIEQLTALAKIAGGPSYGDLKLNPKWDSLRDDPRFDNIIASLAPK
jgi:tetratricopeptide (TPR) repeat protein